MNKTLMLGAALALGLTGSAYASSFSSSFGIGGATGTVSTSSGGGSSSLSGSASMGGGLAGGATGGFSQTEGGAQATGDFTGVQVQDFRNSSSGGFNISGSDGFAGTLNGMRWSHSSGQLGGHDKLGSGCRQAANLSISISPYASSGVRPAKAE